VSRASLRPVSASDNNRQPIFDMLNRPLDRKHVSQRKQSNFTLSYIEGHHAIREANRIFGFDGWEYDVKSFNVVSSEQYEKAGYNNGPAIPMHRICVAAIVTVTALGVTRQDVGYGTGTAKTLADAHESAGKEAVTDALKRALRTFGDQFGNALYDKQQTNVVDYDQVAKEDQITSHILNAIANAQDMQVLSGLIQACSQLSDANKAKVRQPFADKKKSLTAAMGVAS